MSASLENVTVEVTQPSSTTTNAPVAFVAEPESVNVWYDFAYFSYIWPMRREFLCFILVVILLPIGIFTSDKAICCGMIVILMGILWMTETLPLAVTALIPMVAYPFFDIISSKQIAGEYMTHTNFIFVGSLIMALAVEKTNLHERIALWILLNTGTSPRWLMLGFQIGTCLLSLW